MNRKTRELAFELSNGFCQCSKECVKCATDCHHMLPNTKPNRKRFPLFIDSIFNIKTLANDCHLTKPIPTISDRQAEIYEEWLNDFLKGDLK